MYNRAVLLFLALFLTGFSLKAQVPKIAVVLSGGGAKGLAHVGALKALEAHGIRPDYVTGTSMGALVGALYSIGYSVEQLEAMAMELNWDAYFNDRVPQNYRPIEDKLSPAQYQLGFPLFEGKPEFPRGLIDGENFLMLLTRLTIPVHGQNDFDQFPIPFRCVATDLETGQAVVFDRGDLADVLRASASIPTVFSPAELNGKLLVDGGVIRNFPVVDALEMGADYVIGIDVGAPLYAQDELNSLINILDQTSSFRIVESSAEQKKLANLVIRPAIEGYTALAFEQRALFLSLGEIATQEKIPQLLRELKAIGYPIRDSLPLRPPLQLPQEIQVSALDFFSESTATTTTLEQLFRLPTDKKVTLDQVDDQIRLLFAAEYFSAVDYRLFLQADSSYLMQLRAKGSREAAVKVGINYDANLKAGLLMSYNRRNLWVAGSLFSADLKIAENPILQLSYRWQTPTKPNLGLRLQLLLNSYPGYQYVAQKRIATRAMSYGRLKLGVYSGLNRNWLLGLSAGWEARLERPEFLLLSSEATLQIQPFITLELRANTLDQQVFSERGFRFDATAHYVPDGQIRTANESGEAIVLKDIRISRAQLSYIHAIPVVEFFTLQPIVQAGILRSSDPYYLHLMFLGRPLPYLEQYVSFSGFRHMERPVTAYAFGGLRMQGRIGTNVYCSLIYNQGYFEQVAYRSLREGRPVDWAAERGMIGGMGLELGYLSPGGPIQWNVEYNPFSNQWSMALSMGYVF